MADTSRACTDCGVIFDAGAVDGCPVCHLFDRVDALGDEVNDLSDSIADIRGAIHD